MLIHNPAAGQSLLRRRLSRLVEALAGAGFAVELAPTTAPGDATRLAAEVARAGPGSAVFAFGGDGTLREAAKGLAGTGVPLGVLPGGTTNVVALALGLPADALAAARAFAGARERTIDLGLAGDEPFLMQATAGLDARIMARLHAPTKRLFGKLAVAWTGFAEWSRYRFPDIDFVADGRRGSATAVAVCNIAHYAGDYRLVPAGRFDDRRLELFLFRGRRRRDAAAFAYALARGRHIERGDVEIRPVDEFELLGPRGTPLQIDGDPLAAAFPLLVRLAPQRLTVLAPFAAPR